MQASERKKAEYEMTDKEWQIYASIQKENEFMEIVLSIAKGETNKDRLGKMLYNLQIGNRRDYNGDLKGFIKGAEKIKASHKEAFIELLEENDEIYKQVQEIICEKLEYTQEEIDLAKKQKEESEEIGLEDPRGIESDEHLEKEQIIASLLGRKANQIDTKNNFDDFHIEQVKLNLKLSLTNIKNSLDIIEENLTHIDLTKMQPGTDDAKALASLVRRSKIAAADWNEYLINEKMKKKFILQEDSLLNLFNDTIGPSKRTWELATMMEQEMIQAGLVNKEEIEELAEQKLSFNAKKYWADDAVRSADIENDVDKNDIDNTYTGNPAYEEDKKTFLKYKYFDDVIRSERDMEKAEEGLGVDFKVTKMELMTTNGKRKLLNIYYKIPEDMRDTIEKVTKTIGFNANSRFTAIFSFLAGRISKNQDTFFTGDGAGSGGNSERARHRRFSEEMGGSGHTHGHQDPHEHRDPHEQPTYGHDGPEPEDDGRDDR